MTPARKPGRSKQDYQTPPELLAAIKRDFSVGQWGFDLAANANNAVCPWWFGPGSAHGENALEQDWGALNQWPGSDLWLNPPFSNIDPWSEKCSTSIRVGRIFLLVPASVGSNWYQAHVHGQAHVVATSPRVTFVGCEDPYPKDLVLAVFGPVRGGFSTWRWKP